MIWKVVWHGQLPNNEIQTRSIFNATIEDDTSDGDAVDALEDWSQTMWEAVKNVVDDQFSIPIIEYFKLHPSTTDEWDLVESRDYGSTLSGNSGSVDTLPTATQGVVTVRTTRSRSRGRKFIPGITESYNVEGAPNSGALDALTDFAAVYISEFISGGVTLVPIIYSILHGALSIAGATIKQQWGVLRKREAGVGI